MQLAERIGYLKGLDLFSAFSQEQLHGFAAKIVEVTYAAGELLFQEGDIGDALFILLEGELKVFKENRLITVIRPVDYVGEMAVIEDKPRSATVLAAADCLLMRITAEQFQAVVRQPASMLIMMKVLSQRIRRDTELLAQEFEKANILIHDMRNMLSPFLFLQSLKREITEEKKLQYIAYMLEGRQNLLVLMEEALANAKRQQRPLPFVVDSLSDLILEVAENELFIHPDMLDKHLHIVIQRPLPDFPFFKLDIRRALVNLVINAAQASHPQGLIEVTLNYDVQFAVIKVRDHGLGIPENLKERIFQVNFTTKETGCGLGLASCMQVVTKRHGGRISFESERGKGTEFTVLLPLVPIGLSAGD